MTISAVNISGADQSIQAGATAFYGYSLAETAGAAASMIVYNDASGTSGGDAPILATIKLAANQSVDVMYPVPLNAQYGVYIDVVAGAIAGSVRLGA